MQLHVLILRVRPSAEAAIDLQGPVVEEAVLLQGPVRGVRARLAELLAEWPDHPLLTQLAAIADRLLGVAAYCGITFCIVHFSLQQSSPRAPDTQAHADILPA